ncbi:GTP pyrophosphokinase [Corynebacterium anserum]|uniref:Uncharacterized protein n=1 Tax=Corynebacterium anserum TaxID=2684406 RepID=A0A7G7YN09_9CORY|nr:hypothetical protein [Corynebacterium anserum]MBC2680886.1 hypothetical protein [Corynebacterium anserum]QNH95879.1 hypothetical protein GP473_03580 [Corynebacterium anserum]
MLNTTDALAQYDQWRDRYPTACADVRALIEDALDDAGITYDQVVVRTKERVSFLAKLTNPDYPNYTDIASAYDMLGARVITYHSSNIPQLLTVIENIFSVETVVDKAAETARRGGFGYASQHVIVRVPQLDNMLMEIQLRTVLQHAWAEFEHDIRYKNLSGSTNPEVQRAFTLAAGLIELADQQFDLIANRIDQPTDASLLGPGPIDEVTLPRLLADILGENYPASKVAYYGYAVDMLAAHGITTNNQLLALLSKENLAKLHAAFAYPYPPGQVRVVDDMLLLTFGREHIKKTVHIGDDASSRPGRLGNRWQKIGQKTLEMF